MTSSAAIRAGWDKRRARMDAEFYDHADRSGGVGACWPWTGSIQTGGGYGYLTRRGKVVYAHRRALELALGRPLLPGMQAMHACDNRPCVNPTHLSEGTNGDNVRDMIAKGRRELPRDIVCPDCGAVSQGIGHKGIRRCEDCARKAQKAKRQRSYVAWRANHSIKCRGKCLGGPWCNAEAWA